MRLAETGRTFRFAPLARPGGGSEDAKREPDTANLSIAARARRAA